MSVYPTIEAAIAMSAVQAKAALADLPNPSHKGALPEGHPKAHHTGSAVAR